jgi:nucleotide-binding universal stress UspA family protein
MKDKLIPIATQTEYRAQILREHFERAGIEFKAKYVNILSPLVTSGVQIMVYENDMEKTREILAEIDKEYGAETINSYEDAKEINRILVSVDFSDYSRNACDLALNIAMHFKSHIQLLYTIYSPEISSMPFEDSFSYSETFSGVLLDLKSQVEKDMKKLAKDMNEKAAKKNIFELSIDYEIERGFLEDTLIYSCESYRPDLVLMGCVDKHLRADFATSDVPLKVVNSINCPILIIPQEAKNLDIRNFHHLMYATEFDESDFIAIKKMMKLIFPFDIKISCTHIGQLKENPWDSVRMDGLKDYFRKVYKKDNVECHFIRNEDKLKGLLEFVQQHDIDILALTTRKRNILSKFFTSGFTRKVLHQTEIPLLIFHT